MACASAHVLPGLERFVDDAPRIVARGVRARAAAPMFAGAVSRRGHEVLVGAAAAVTIAALWATGAWMTVDVARALDEYQRAAATQLDGGAVSDR